MGASIKYNVMPVVDTSPVVECPNGPCHHLGMLVAGENLRGADDAVVHIAAIVEYSASTGTSSHKFDGWQIRGGSRVSGFSEKIEVDFQPRILIPANDNAWSVDIQEENC